MHKTTLKYVRHQIAQTWKPSRATTHLGTQSKRIKTLSRGPNLKDPQ